MEEWNPPAAGGFPLKPTEFTILVVDDYPDAAESMGEFLGLHGHSIHVAHGGAEAIEKALLHKPDVVLLDVAMPGTNGLEVARVLSSQADYRPLLVAISGFCSKADKAIAFQAGFSFFFAKPMNTDHFLRILHTADNYVIVAKNETVEA
jgi:two-component system, sensor histidine kinase